MPNPRWRRFRSASGDWEPFLQYCSTLSQYLGLISCKDNYFKIFCVDFSAQQLISAKELYESFSFFAPRRRLDSFLELPVRCMIELTANLDFYLADGYGERLLGGFKNLSSVLDPEVLCSSSPRFVKRRNTSKLGRYGSFWEPS